MARIRTLNFLPEVFQTPPNAQFLAATLDQLVNSPSVANIQGYVGSTFGTGVNATNSYVTEPTKTRTDYQLDPGVIFTKTNESTAKDFITYPGIIDALKMEGGITENNDKLFTSQFYSWDSFTNLDTLINFNQYYWLPDGPPSVQVTASTVFSREAFVVTDNTNTYSIVREGSTKSNTNPSITLLRGGTYTFQVDQDTQFWIQGAPGVSGYSPTQPNQSVRDIYGVDNNGATSGIVTFQVPQRNAQDQYIFPATVNTDLISTIPFDDINGQFVNSFAGIDGITSLLGLRVAFYNTPQTTAYISSYFSETEYDTNAPGLVAPITLTVDSCDTSAFTLDSGTTSGLIVGGTVTFTGVDFGGINLGQVYFIQSIPNSTSFTISTSLNGDPIALTAASGTMTVNVNQGLYEDGYDVNVGNTFFRVTYIGDPANPIIRLVSDGAIPLNTRILPVYGDEWNNIPFYLNTFNSLELIPYISAPLDVLYYQDGTNPNKVGIIRLIEDNLNNSINVETQILGRTNYTSPNGVIFTNGLKVSFDGDVIPTSYLTGEYYVQGVGVDIDLVPVETLAVPEKFSEGEYVAWDILGWDIGNWDISLNIPVKADYITIARNSINKNAWARSNRWFHIDVINATATYNDDPTIVTTFANVSRKAVRPIIEFYPNLKLFNSGAVGKDPVDFIDTTNTDALSTVPNSLAYYPDVQTYSTASAIIAATPTTPIAAGSFELGATYQISTYGTTTDWNEIAGTIGDNYAVGSILLCVNAGSGDGFAVPLATSTTITVDANELTGALTNFMFIADSTALLPANTQIIDISGTETLTLTVIWAIPQNIAGATGAILYASDTTVNNYGLFPGARVIFAADNDVNVRSKIYVSNFSVIAPSTQPVITLIVAEDGIVVPDTQTVITRGFANTGLSYWFNGIDWRQSQQKTQLNQAPEFDIIDGNGISFSDPIVYPSTTFTGCKLFNYTLGLGAKDPILGFPIRYSSVSNLGDISFDVSLNSDTFSYVYDGNPFNEKVNNGYVYNITSAVSYDRLLGWETAVAPSQQYQIFDFDFSLSAPAYTFVCDIAALPALPPQEKGWPRVLVYINNVYQEPSAYSVEIGTNKTTIRLLTQINENTVVQVLLLSDQVSKVGYYQIPLNLSNNPLNTDLTTVNTGDIRTQYQDIFINAPNTTGTIFGANNFRDCGDLNPYGTKIIQNSASLVLPGTFLRNPQYNLFAALQFNSREYVNYKQLLIDTVQNTPYEQRYTPAEILDDALDQITAAKSEINAFFWSDMLPNKSSYISNTYAFNNDLDRSQYPLSHVYNFESANYDGVLVYITRAVDNILVERQLISGTEYVISTDSPTLIITIPMLAGDIVTIREYNQTYGSYVPNTPTKLGIYPKYIPQVILDSNYLIPTYFILGHDGSYTKLYGDYIPEFDILVDFRDQALLEFEKRIYNNLKLSTETPITRYEVLPGFFRDPTYSWNEFLRIYSTQFLNWIGQNRIDYKTQYFSKVNEFTYNYTNSTSKVDNLPILQGYWRGVYEYYYDTTTPDTTPWEMLGFTIMPTWWTERYGPAPYTSDNGILWNDLEQGLIWNNGNPYINPLVARPGLSNIIPVNSNGDLLSPFDVIVSDYNPNTFNKNWVVGDDGPAELSYRRSSTFPFDLTRIFALTRPAEFYNLCVDLDNYKYNAEFNQYLFNDRSHLVPSNIEIYGNGIAKTSYINWIVDYEKQQGIDATTEITTTLDNLDVRLVYRLAGYSDKTMLQFFVEKPSPASNNASLLIPDESYSVLLYDNQPFDRILFSGVIVQKNQGYWTVYGNSQNIAYFEILDPAFDGKFATFSLEKQTVKVAVNYTTKVSFVPYGTKFYTPQDLAQFLISYGKYLESKGMMFNDVQNGIPITWGQMVYEYLYWIQTGWSVGSVITLNPAATTLDVDKPSALVQPLTIQQQNFVLNQNLYPIRLNDLCVNRNDTLFHMHTLNSGDTMAYAQFNFSNFEHGIVFDNTTLFNDIVYNLTTGLRQNRIYVRGQKTAEWNGTVNAFGFIINQSDIKEFNSFTKYTKNEIVKYKNKYWSSLTIIEPSNIFDETKWKRINYSAIQKGMFANPSTRAYESTLYYNAEKANLEKDADLLAFSLIGYRPRDYLALIDLTDTAQVQVYKNLIKNKGTLNALSAFKGANLPQGGIQYDIYENWAIKSGEYGGVLNQNFVEFRINQTNMTGDPAIVSLTNGDSTEGAMQEIPLSGLFNYGTAISSPNILSTTTPYTIQGLYPSAGYVNFNDVKMSTYFYSGLPTATNINDTIIPIQNFYVGEYLWMANFKEKWGVFRWKTIGQVTQVRNNQNQTAIVTFNAPHELKRLDPMAIINFATNVDGYYIVTDIVNMYEVIINLSVVGANQTTVQGRGLGFAFESQRVATPSEIETLDLTENEFIKNTVWVDENNDGGWAVYRKSINYQRETQFQIPQSSTYGSAVAYTDQAGYLIGDAGNNVVYRYLYDPMTDNSQLYQTVTPYSPAVSSGFGSSIAHAQNIYAIAANDPVSVTNKTYIYVINDSIISKYMLPYQSTHIDATVNDIAISDDANWMYLGIPDSGIISVYRRDNILINAGYLTVDETYVITSIGTTDFTAIGAIENKVGVAFIATASTLASKMTAGFTYKIVTLDTTNWNAIGYTGIPTVGGTFVYNGVDVTGTGTVTGNIASTSGTATQATYKFVTNINCVDLGLTSASAFGQAVATNYDGSVLVVGASKVELNSSIDNWGAAYIYQRAEQNFETQFTSIPYQPQTFQLAWTPADTKQVLSSVDVTSNYLTVNSVSGLEVGMPVMFTGTGLSTSDISPYITYYIQDIVGSTIALKNSRSTNTPITLNDSTVSCTMYPQDSQLYVSVNGSIVQDNNYAVGENTFYYTGALRVGDIVSVSGNEFFMVQEVNSAYTDRSDIYYGTSVATTRYGSDVLVGSPYEIDTEGKEGAVYSYVNGGAKYGVVIGTSPCNLLGIRILLINGYAAFLPAGNATIVASAINSSNITNIQAIATVDNKIIIQLIDNTLAGVNDKLVLSVFDNSVLNELGIQIYTNTQVIKCPHGFGPTEFGYNIKTNQSNSIVVSAPVGTRYEGTFFDFTDDENLNNDTVFDNNATRFVDSYPNAGAVYMFEYLSNNNESVSSPGSWTYAQSVNDNSTDYGFNPQYGAALDFNSNVVVVGSPNFQSTTIGGKVVVYINATGVNDWAVYRQSSAVVDINRIQNTQLFGAITNDTLVNLDYIDPLQNKILGAARENLDFVTGVDPATYNVSYNTESGPVWGASHIGKLWFDTSNVRWVNYHQNDVVYNSRYWGEVFPGSDVAVYSWISSFISPQNYQGPGVPYDVNQYVINNVINSSNIIVPVYYFWVRNTNVIFSQTGKTLSDSVVQLYIASPRESGISYMVPLLPNTFGIYNSGNYINANDSVFHIGFSNGQSDDVIHNEYSLIRANFQDDFLPGFPNVNATHVESGTHSDIGQQYVYGTPYSLYAKMLDSLAGCTPSGTVVPDPFLPAAVQTGVLVRPSQSFFYNRLAAIENYLTYANDVIINYPIFELREELSFLFTTGEFYNTPDYWTYVDWWAPGYNSGSKPSVQVSVFADLSSLKVPVGTIARVALNGSGKWEIYVQTATGVWNRIGLQNGTLQFKSDLWDYVAGKLGWSGNFFDTTSFDVYPSEETRSIIRALNEQIYISDLFIHRNKSLILLFEYIQAETIESQNYLPWLNKTSLADVSHVIRELFPYEVYKTDDQAFLSGYVNETKPYHVVIKDFLFKYTRTDVFEGDITDFDVPAVYNSTDQQFISPQLVYTTDTSGIYEYNVSDPIWQTNTYSQWFQNFGLSITGEPEFPITVLNSFLTRGTSYIIVDNAQGFPTNGVITIGIEQIGYSYVDRALNIVGGLSRGLNETTPVDHIPGEKIFIDLPAVILLDGGRGYTNPPKVTAVIDTTKYPAPRQVAVFDAVLGADSVVQINVVNPGSGYVVLPTLEIEPSLTVYFNNTDINSTFHTITTYAPDLKTGDLVRYRAGVGEGAGRLADGQWYYINVLASTTVSVISLYSTYSNAINDQDRITLFDNGAATGMSLNLGARASIITSSAPIRENIITLRFDRTTYGSRVVDWQADSFYGAYFAGSYYSVDTTAASSHIQLQSTNPDINTLLASAAGAVFEIVNVQNQETLTWSSFVRNVEETIDAGSTLPDEDRYLVRLTLASNEPNASGSTIGFYEGMPIKFTGGVAGTNIIDGTTYYVAKIINETDFSIKDINGTVIILNSITVTVPMLCYTGEITDIAILTFNYPGILTATATTASNNAITVPLTALGTGGTNGFYPGLTVFFTGTDAQFAAFGNKITANEVYYINTIIDYQTFTISEFKNPTFTNVLQNIADTTIVLPITATVTETIGSSDIVVLDSNANFNFNDPVIFNTMFISGSAVSNFGNIVSGTVYYVSEVIDGSPTQIRISATRSGVNFNLSTVSAADDTSAVATNQSNVIPLINATGELTMNVALPVSPGQVNGQQFKFYQTSIQYPDITSGVISNLIKTDVYATIANVNKIAVDSTTNFYTNLPVQFEQPIGLGSYNASISGTTMTVSSLISGGVFVGAEITGTGVISGTTIVSQLSGVPNGIGSYQVSISQVVPSSPPPTSVVINNVPCLIASTTYYVLDYSGKSVGSSTLSNLEVQVQATSSTGNQLICYAGTDTSDLYVDMPITFSGTGLGGLIISDQYFVRSIIDSTHFTVSALPGEDAITLQNDSGFMVGTGYPYITVSSSPGGLPVSLSSSTTLSVLAQIIPLGEEPIFDLSYILGGYRAIISDGGSGFAVNNVITISGTEVDGLSPKNDITLIVSEVDTNGTITRVIRSGEPPKTELAYYLKVISATQFEVYENSLMTIPVSGKTFPYVGFTTTTATEITASSDNITVTSSADFDINDPVVFTGAVFSTEIVPGQTYYIYDKPTATTVRITDNPGGSLLVFNITAIGSMTMAKAGSFAYLPQPFYFQPSVTRYNNRLYECLVSNSDPEFIFGKWQLVDSDSRNINAMDRVIGYYQPTANMPGVDLTQLFEGVTYPNPIYYGNEFEPAKQFDIDTNLQDQPFYPTDVQIKSVVYNDGEYYAAANIPNYSAVIYSDNNENWSIARLSNSNLNVTDILYNNGTYIMTSTNSATPIFRSTNGIVWSTNGYFTPWGIPTQSESMTSLGAADLSLNTVTYFNNFWYAAGDSIVTSSDAYSWGRIHAYTPSNQVRIYGINTASIPNFTGLVAVGSGIRIDTGIQLLTNIISTSTDGIVWQDLDSLTNKAFYSVAANNSRITIVGESGVIYYSTDGTNFLGLNEAIVTDVNDVSSILSLTNTTGLTAGDTIRFTTSFSSILAETTYFVKTVVNSTQITITSTLGGSTIGLAPYTVNSQILVYKYDPINPNPDALRDVIYANSVWVAVGDSGTIRTSTDGLVWTTRASGKTENLNGITWSGTEFTVVGDNNTIITSTDGIVWSEITTFSVLPSVYDVKGADFPYGYAPEELVAGNVRDNIAITVNTRPGTNWNAEEYANVGYNVVSIQIMPESQTQTVYSFDRVVQVPAQVAVQVLDALTMLGTTLSPTEYTVDWVNKTITLDTPISFTPYTETLRIDVYEVGNGDQLVKSSTHNDPIRIDINTGFNQIYLNCNYSDRIFNGNGVIRPGSFDIVVAAIATSSTTNEITCEDVSQFSIGQEITFTGTLFGNVQTNTPYFVKSISIATETITVSLSYDPFTGIAGPTATLTDGIGTMYINLAYGSDVPWTTPYVMHNGTLLVQGYSSQVTGTSSGTDAIITNSTAGMIVGMPVTFSNTMFGNVVQPITRYYVTSVIDSKNFTISASPDGPNLTLTNATGGAYYITNDFAFGLQPNNIQATLIFATDNYNNNDDYLCYSIFGEGSPVTYGYTIPQRQEFVADGTTVSFVLSNYVGEDNPANAIVEIDGVRQNSSEYNLSFGTNSVSFLNAAPAAGSIVSVTSYNITGRQYLNTQYGISGNIGSSFATFIIGTTTNITGTWDQNNPDVQSYDQNTPSVIAWDAQENWLTLSSGSTGVLTVNDPIIFDAPTIGGIVAGQTYYVTAILDSTRFVISTTPGGTAFRLTNDSGSMTANADALIVAEIINVDNVITPPLATTLATATDSVTDEITVISTAGFIENATVEFRFPIIAVSGLNNAKIYQIVTLGSTNWTSIGYVGTPVVGGIFTYNGTATTGTGTVTQVFGGISSDGTVYFVHSIIDSTRFKIKDADGTLVQLSTTIGNMEVIVGGQPAVRVRTAIQTGFTTNTLVRIDDIQGSTQLNNNTYYIHVIDNNQFDLYNQPYTSSSIGVNYPVTNVSNYVSGGFVWRQGSFYIVNTYATQTNAASGQITVNSTSGLIYGTPIYFTQFENLSGDNLMGGIIQGTEYYVREVFGGSITVSSTRGGPAINLTDDTGYINVTQWQQTNVDRLWVTINGYRVPSSKLKLNGVNEVSILAPINPSDVIIITSMMPSATPDQQIYLNMVDYAGNPAVYSANDETRTWLTSTLGILDTVMYVDDVTSLTQQVVQHVTAPIAVNNYYTIGLDADKRTLTGLVVYNNTTDQYISNSHINIILVDSAPTAKIASGSWITAGDSLTITSLEGNTVYINGEQIKFTTLNPIITATSVKVGQKYTIVTIGTTDFTAIGASSNTIGVTFTATATGLGSGTVIALNAISGIQRGANGTGSQLLIPQYTDVIGLLGINKMNEVDYSLVWNSYVYNTEDGDPLQISQTVPAEFLNM